MRLSGITVRLLRMRWRFGRISGGRSLIKSTNEISIPHPFEGCGIFTW